MVLSVVRGVVVHDYKRGTLSAQDQTLRLLPRGVGHLCSAWGLEQPRRRFASLRKLELKPDDVLRYLLSRRVFRVGLEFTCPNCELPSWVHLDDVRTKSTCSYCDHNYDVTPQLRDRDWRYRRSGIFGREDDQLGGVPVALTLQQLSTALHEQLVMYSTAMKFHPAGADIEPCEADFVAVIAGAVGLPLRSSDSIRSVSTRSSCGRRSINACTQCS